MEPVAYLPAGYNMTEIQYWDVFDEQFHSYLVEGGFLLEEIIGEAGNILAELPEGAKVFITSGDLNHLIQMEQGLEDYLINDIEFVTPDQVLKGALRGRDGVLLITNTWILQDSVRWCLYQEAEALKCHMGRFTMCLEDA